MTKVKKANSDHTTENSLGPVPRELLAITVRYLTCDLIATIELLQPNVIRTRQSSTVQILSYRLSECKELCLASQGEELNGLQ